VPGDFENALVEILECASGGQTADYQENPAQPAHSCRWRDRRGKSASDGVRGVAGEPESLDEACCASSAAERLDDQQEREEAQQ